MTRGAARPFIHVVAAAVIDATGRVLIAQRLPGTHMAGGWEFPGGKLEPGEERLAGLARELREEIGITLGAPPRPLIRVRHAYPSREVLLDVWVVRSYGGEPRGLDGQALRWCTHEELAEAPLLPADEPIVAALRLPDRLTQMSTLYYCVREWNSPGYPTVGDERTHDTSLRGVQRALTGADCASAAEAVVAADAGADFLVLRAALNSSELSLLCRTVPIPVYVRGATLEEAWALGASGLSEIDG